MFQDAFVPGLLEPLQPGPVGPAVAPKNVVGPFHDHQIFRSLRAGPPQESVFPTRMQGTVAWDPDHQDTRRLRVAPEEKVPINLVKTLVVGSLRTRPATAPGRFISSTEKIRRPFGQAALRGSAPKKGTHKKKVVVPSR
jgi:hypothetical protein